LEKKSRWRGWKGKIGDIQSESDELQETESSADHPRSTRWVPTKSGPKKEAVSAGKLAPMSGDNFRKGEKKRECGGKEKVASIWGFFTNPWSKLT